MKLKKYIVNASCITYYQVEVKAKDRYDAMDRAGNIDGGDWVEIVGDTDWEITGAEQK